MKEPKDGWFRELYHALKRSITCRFTGFNDPLAKVDLHVIVQDILANDLSVNEFLRARVKRLILEQIERISNLNDLDLSGQFNLTEHLIGENNLTVIAANLIKADLASKLGEKIKDLITERIDELDNGDIFGEESFDEFLERIGLPGHLDNQTKLVLTENPQAIAAMQAKALSQLLEFLDNLQDYDLIDENLAETIQEAIGAKNIISAILQNENVKQVLASVIQSSIVNAFGKDVEEE